MYTIESSAIMLTSGIRTTFWFLSGNNIHLYGGGTIDGNGQVWYDTLASSQVRARGTPRMRLVEFREPVQNKATAGASTRSFARPIPLTVGNATNVLVENIFQIASPNWVSNMSSNRCNRVDTHNPPRTMLAMPSLLILNAPNWLT